MPWGDAWNEWDLEEVITWEIIDELVNEEKARAAFTESIKKGHDPFAKPKLII